MNFIFVYITKDTQTVQNFFIVKKYILFMCIYLTSQDLTGLAPIKQQRHENYTNTYCGGK